MKEIDLKQQAETKGNDRLANLCRCRQQLEHLLKEAEALTGEKWMMVPAVEDDPEEARKAAQYRRLAYLQVLENDLRCIRRRFPKEKIGSLSQLGEEYYALRSSGIGPEVACAAVLKSRGVEELPPEMGLLGHGRQDRKEYYTPAEVDRLTEKELKDPNVMAAVRWSMTRWKHR